MDDLISRKAAINALRQEVILCKLSLESPFLNNREKKDLQIRKAQAIDDIVAIEGLPSVERRGRWTTERTMEHDGEWYCSVCGYEPIVYEATNYCPNCGARMEAE